MTVTVTHPTFPDVSYDVPEADVPRWKAAGWLAPKADADPPKTAKNAAEKG